MKRRRVKRILSRAREFVSRTSPTHPIDPRDDEILLEHAWKLVDRLERSGRLEVR